jgi:hypothetical protein
VIFILKISECISPVSARIVRVVELTSSQYVGHVAELEIKRECSILKNSYADADMMIIKLV